MTATTDFQIIRNPFGRLVLTNTAGETFEGVTAVRAFPIQAPEQGIAIVCRDGHEVAWVDRLSDLPEPMRRLLEEELASREFMPEIRRISHVSSFATPCTWHVETDRGETEFILRGEEDIRRISQSMLLIADSHGIHFLVRDISAMDWLSRRILDRFL